jgi:tetratricopeptide (TPR) repeat protein
MTKNLELNGTVRAIVSVLALIAFAQADCVAPRVMEAGLRAHPDARTFAQLGAWFEGRHQYGCAAEAYRSTVNLDPGSAHVLYLLGASLSSAGDLEGAVDALQRSIKLAPAVLAPHVKLAAALEQLKRKDEAQTEWGSALKIAPRSIAALDGLSQHFIAAGNYAAAIGLLRSAPKNESLILDLAQAYGKSGMFSEAFGTLTKALSAYPSSLPLTNALTTVMINQGQHKAAELLTEKFAKARADSPEAQRLYLRVLVVNSKWTVALPLARKLLARSPRDAYFLYVNGMMERQMENYVAARDHLQQAVALDPYFYNSHYNLGLALAKLGDLQEAREQFEKAIALGANEPEVHFQLAKALGMLGKTEEAQRELKLYREVAEADSNRSLAEGKAVQAQNELAGGNTQKAIALYREALDATPQNALLNFKLAIALDKTGDTAAERTALEKAIEIDPDMAIAHNQLGYLASRSGDSTSAEEHFRQAVRAAPGYIEAWVSLAATLGMESKLSEAQEAVNTALRLDPSNAAAQQLRQELDATHGR